MLFKNLKTDRPIIIRDKNGERLNSRPVLLKGIKESGIWNSVLESRINNTELVEHIPSNLIWKLWNEEAGNAETISIADLEWFINNNFYEQKETVLEVYLEV